MNKHHTRRASAMAIRCKDCNGRGSALATQCPGKTINERQSEGIALGTLDFRNGQWVEAANSDYAFMLLDAELKGAVPGSKRALEIKAIMDASDYHLDSRLGCVPKAPLVLGWQAKDDIEEVCTSCSTPLDAGQIGLCDTCQGLHEIPVEPDQSCDDCMIDCLHGEHDD